jgi:hypothetical protein
MLKVYRSMQDYNEMNQKQQVKSFVTEYEPKKDESEIEIIQARVQFAILDQIEHMERLEIKTQDKVKKLIFRDVQNYIDEYFEK